MSTPTSKKRKFQHITTKLHANNMTLLIPGESDIESKTLQNAVNQCRVYTKNIALTWNIIFKNTRYDYTYYTLSKTLPVNEYCARKVFKMLPKYKNLARYWILCSSTNFETHLCNWKFKDVFTYIEYNYIYFTDEIYDIVNYLKSVLVCFGDTVLRYNVDPKSAGNIYGLNENIIILKAYHSYLQSTGIYKGNDVNEDSCMFYKYLGKLIHCILSLQSIVSVISDTNFNKILMEYDN
jgi:hypothetical protein